MDHIEGGGIPQLGGNDDPPHCIVPSNGAQLAPGIRGKGLAIRSSTQYASVNATFECFRNGSACNYSFCVRFWIKLLGEGSDVTSVYTCSFTGQARFHVIIGNSSVKLHFTDTTAEWYFPDIVRLAPGSWVNFAFNFKPTSHKVCIAINGPVKCYSDRNVDSYPIPQVNRQVYFGDMDSTSNDLSSFVIDDVFLVDRVCSNADMISFRSQGAYKTIHTVKSII